MFLFKFYDLPSENGLSFAKYVDLYFADFYMENSAASQYLASPSLSLIYTSVVWLTLKQVSQGYARWRPELELVFMLTLRKDFPTAPTSTTTDELG